MRPAQDLLLDEELGQRCQHLPLGGESLTDSPVGGLEKLLDLRVDPARRVFAVFARRRRRHVEEQCLARRLERPEPESLAHPVPGHHVAGQVGGTLEIVLGAYREEDMNPMERVLADDWRD
jgi:hypothetical protein